MFNKNIEILSQKNPLLADKIVKNANINSNLNFLKTESGDFVLCQDSIAIDGVKSPYNECLSLVEEQIRRDLDKFDFIVVFGLGMGYLLDTILSKYNSKVLVFEPNLDILKITLQNVDLSEHLKKEVFIFDNQEELLEFIEKNFMTNDKIEFCYYPNYAALRVKDLEDLSNKILNFCQEKVFNANTIKKFSKSWAINSINRENYSHLYYPINLLDGVFRNKTALIIGAGPSLKENLDFIKKHRKNLVIFAVNKALNVLEQENICPNFAVFIDSVNFLRNINHSLEFLNNVNIINDFKVDHTLYQAKPKRWFTYYSNNSKLANIINQKEPDFVKLKISGGTSTLCAFNSAIDLGFKNIVICGVDLAFKNDKTYADDTILNKDLINKRHKLVEVKSINGKTILSRGDYVQFIGQFENRLKTVKDVNVFNLSSFGAYIEGMQYCNSNELEEKIDLNEDYSFVDFKIDRVLKQTNYSPKNTKKFVKEIILKEIKLYRQLLTPVNNWLLNTETFETQYNQALSIINQVQSTIILSEAMQIELAECVKTLSQKDNNLKQQGLIKFFTALKTILDGYCKNFINL